MVGLVEVLGHLPRIYDQYRNWRAAATRKPDLAILTDSPDFHLRLARRLKACEVPVIYLIAPWSLGVAQGRSRMRRSIDRLVYFSVRGKILPKAWHCGYLYRTPSGRAHPPPLTKTEFFGNTESRWNVN